MKLITDIKPRKDGTVSAYAGEKNWTFKADENGELVGVVDDDAALAQLLATGNFQPYDEADLGAATVLAQSVMGEGAGDDEGDEGDEEDDDDEAVQGGLPVEAGTPPAARPGKGRKAK